MAGRMCGHVADPAGLAVPDATVLIVASSRPTPDIAALTDADGHFVFDGLEAGKYVVRAQAPTGEIGVVDVTVLDSATTVVYTAVGSEPPSA